MQLESTKTSVYLGRKMKEIYSLLDLRNIIAVFAIYEMRGNNKCITAIWQTTHLKKSVLSRLFSNFDELILAEPNRVINPKIVEIRWWEINKFFYSDRRQAAVLIAKELLKNEKPSSIDYKYLAESTKKFYNDPSFRSDMKAIFNGEPSGILKDINIEKDVNRIEEFRENVNKLINSPKSELLGIFNSDQKKRIFKHIWRIDYLETIDFAYYLAYDHQYDEFIFHNLESRNLFALALALDYLSEKIRESQYRQGTVSAFAVLLATEYEINFDAPRLYKEIYGADAPENAGQRASYGYAPSVREVKNPSIPYSDHFQTWPELQHLRDASIQAKKALIYIILRVGKSMRYLSLRKLPNYEMLIDGIKYLKGKDLVYENPSDVELLGCLTYKELKKFALEIGIKIIPQTKRGIINTINSYADPTDVAALIKDKVDIEQPVKLLVNDPYSLKKFFIEEMDRIDLYKIWIENVRYHKIPDIQDIKDKSIHIPEPHDDFKKAYWGTWYMEKNITPISHAQLTQINIIWDRNCDQILTDLVNKYHWDTPYYIEDSIVEYLPAGKFYAFKESCRKIGKGGWRGIIQEYGIQRIHELNINIRKPIKKKCTGCGKEFLETSIFKGTSNRVGYKILFCLGCYQKALYGEGKGDCKIAPEVMLTKLSSYVNKIGFIPTANSMKNIDLSWISDEDQGDIVKLLLDMPTYEQYVEKFGSWLNALNQAKLIDDKSLRSTFGYRCIAIDGHECYSLSEKFIDDWLFNNDVEHDKEPKYPYHPLYNPSRNRRADWQVNEDFIEYAGLMGRAEYTEKMIEKQKLAIELGIRLIILEYEDLENLDEKLALLLDK